jgi:hypothetical protein
MRSIPRAPTALQPQAKTQIAVMRSSCLSIFLYLWWKRSARLQLIVCGGFEASCRTMKNSASIRQLSLTHYVASNLLPGQQSSQSGRPFEP